MKWQKIMCPVDYSTTSHHALDTAARLAAEMGSPLVLFHAWDMPLGLGGEMGIDSSTVAGAHDGASQRMLESGAYQAAENTLDVWQREAMDKGVKVITSLFISGSAWNEIVRAAEADRDIDLIVMGTHGRSGIKRLLLGSVTEQVVRHAPCSVLVVRSHA